MQDFYDYDYDEQQQQRDNLLGQLQQQGLKSDAQLWDPFYGYSEIDYVMDKYPVLKPQIQEGIKKGIPARILDKVISERIEPQLNFMGRPDQVNRILRRTPEIMQRVADYDYIKLLETYKKTFNKSNDEVFRATEISRQTGVSVANLLGHPDLYKDFINTFWKGKENESWTQSAVRGGQNYLTTNKRGEIGLSAWRGLISREDALKQAEEVEKQFIQEPAVLTHGNKWIAGTAGVLTQGWKNQGKGILAGGAFALPLGAWGAVVGHGKDFAQFGFKVGYIAANAWELFEDQAGNDYIDLLRITDENGKPLDENAARAVAAITGAITTGIELGTLSWTLNITPGGQAIKRFLGWDKQVVIDAARSNPVIRQYLANIGKDMAKGITISTLNNVFEAVNTDMKFPLAKLISGQNIPIDPEYWAHMSEHVKQALGTSADFLGSSLFGLVFRMPGIYRTIKKYQTNINTIAQMTGFSPAEVEQAHAESIQAKQEAYNAAVDNPETTPQQLEKTQQQLTQAIVNIPTPEVNIPTADYYFLPADVLRDFISKNEGVDIQGAIDAGAEIGIPKETFDRLRAEHPDFIQENSNSIRMGADGTTAEEANAKVKATDQIQAAIFHSPEIQKEIQQITADYVNAGVDQDTAELTAKLAGAVMSSIKAKTGVDMSFSVKGTEAIQAEQSKLTNMEMLIKNFLDRGMHKDTSDVELPEGIDSEKFSSVIREETSDYAQTLRTINQQAVDSLAASAWNAERYDIGAMPKGKSRHPDARYETVDYDGKTTIDIATQTKKGSENLSIRVKNPKNKKPFVLTIKDFKHADFDQIIKDIRDGVIRGGEILANAPVLKNIGMALADFWHEQGLDDAAIERDKVPVQGDIDSVEHADVPIEGGKIERPEVSVHGGEVEKQKKVNTSQLPVEAWGDYPVVHKGEIPNQLIYPPAREMPNERADIVDSESEIFVPDVQENVAEDQDYPNPNIPMVMADNGMNALGRQNLERDQKAFEETAIERSINAGAHAKTESYVMQSPLVFSLVGMPTDKIVAIKDSKFAATKKSIMNKHSIDWPHFAQVVRELADPIAIFQSSPESQKAKANNDTNPSDRVFLTTMTDGDGASIIVAIQPNHQAKTNAIGVPEYNLFASMFGQSREITHGKKKGQIEIKDDWFGNETIAGRLLYINSEKAAQWEQRTGQKIIPSWIDRTTMQGINPDTQQLVVLPKPKTEQDLRSLWSNPQNEGLYKLDAEGNPVTSINVNVLGELGRSVVHILSDPSSPMQKAAGVHDIGHWLGGLVFGLADEGHPEMQQYRDYFINRVGVTLEQWNAETPNQKGGAREKVYEWVADAFEVYLAEGGKSQDKELQGIFDHIKNFLLEIYRNITEQLGITLNDKDREMFDNLLAMPASDTDTVSDFAAQENSINAEISRVQKLKNDLVSQQQTEIQTSEQQLADLAQELDTDTVEAVENYVDKDPDFDNINQTWQNTAAVETAKGTQIQVQYKIVDADSLITSHTADGKINPNFPQDRQNRDRTRSISVSSIQRMARGLRPQLLGVNILASNGAPIIDKSGIVESGNGRTLAIREAYQSGKAEQYRQWLIDNAHTFGLSPDDVKNLEHPVLVRERLTDVDPVRFAEEANEESIMGKSSTETAIRDVDKLTTDILLRMDTTKPLYENRDFISAFINIIPETERADFLQKNGDISRAGLERIVSALLAKAYDNPSLLDSIGEAYDSTSVNVRQALIAAAPSLAILHHSEHDSSIFLQKDIEQAIRVLDLLHQDGIPVGEWLAQPTLFDDADISPTARELLAFFDRNKNSYKKIASGLIYYANSAMNEATSRETLLFEDSARTKEQILSEAVKYAEQSDTASNLVQEPVSAGLFEKLTKEGKVAPTIPVNPNSYNAFLSITGPEGLLTYLKKRKQYLKRSKNTDSHSTEIERIDSYIQQVSEVYGKQISRGKSNITTRDLRQARSEGKAEGRQQEKALQQKKQQETLAKLREQHRQNIESLEQDFREQRIQDRADILQSRQTEQLMQIAQAAQMADMAQTNKEQIEQQYAQELAQLEADKNNELQQTIQAADYIQTRQAMQAADYMQAKEQEIADIKNQAKTRLQERTEYYKQRQEQAKQAAKEHEAAKLEKSAERFGKKLAKLQKRIDNMTQTRREHNEKHNIKGIVRRIVKMSKSKSISWEALQEIKQLTERFNQDKKNADRRDVLRAFLDIQNNEGEQYTEDFAEDMQITEEELEEFSRNIYLADMTLADVQELKEAAENIYAQGKREYAVWKQQQQIRRANMADKLAHDFGEKWKPTDKEGTTIPVEQEDLRRKYWLRHIGELGTLYWNAVQTPRRFLSSLGQSFVDILFDEATNLRNEAFEHIHQRTKFVLDSIQKLGVSPAEFMKTAVELDGRKYSWQQVMGIWAYMQNDTARDAVLYGNFMNNQAQPNNIYLTEEAALKAINTILEEINKPENERFREAAKILMQDFDMNFDRINDKLIQSRNEGMDREPNYFPMHRLRHRTAGGFTIDAETEQVMQADKAGKLFQKAVDGFTNHRMKLSPAMQQPIDLNMFNVWSKQVNQEEFLGALDEWGGDVFSALTTAGGEHENLQNLILERAGTPAWNIIKTIFNNTVTDDAYAEAEAADKIFGWLIRSRSFYAVAYNVGSALAQFSSYSLALPLTNKLHLFRSLARGIGMAISGRGSQFLENIYRMYPELRYSAGDPILRQIQNARRFKNFTKLGKAVEWSYKGVQVIDNWTKCLVFDAVYQSRISDGMTHEQAVQEAIHAVQDTQPASTSREQADFMRSRGATKFFLFQFMNALVPVFNVAVVDIARNLASPDWNHIKAAAFNLLGVGLSIAVAGGIKDLLKGRLPTGDERPDGSTDSWERWFIDTEIENLLNTAPVLNGILVDWWQQYRGNKRHYSTNRIAEPFQDIGQWWTSFWDTDNEEGTQWGKLMKGASLLGAPIPYNGITQWMHIFGLDEGKTTD